MTEKTGPYQVVELTPGRRVWLHLLDLGGPKHAMYGLLDVDVTAARQRLEAHRERTGEALSFTGFLVYGLARAVDENKAVQAYRKGRHQLVHFDDVNVGMMVEHTGNGQPALMGHVVRRANRKTFLEIHQEIRAVQAAPAPPGRGMPAWLRSALLLPWPLARLFLALAKLAGRNDPTIGVAESGTVFITAVGMFGKGHSGWGITTTPHSLSLVAGGTAWKPAVVEGRIEPREMLSLTVMLDHDVVDGAPAARFVRRLVELIESAAGLEAVAANLDASRDEAAWALAAQG
jgi:pyruvate/2-oxoglutarate dehydrogenase complex dihydrolipoamide acyltransferase (E2) component